MDLKQIEKLMAAVEHARIKRIVIKRQDFEIEIEKECAFSAGPLQPSSLTYLPQPPLPESKPAPIPVSQPQTVEKEVKAGLYVTSPMVGTYYDSPSPGAQPFVKPGDIVNEDTEVCIIEAMKVMNIIKAGVKGSVAEVLLRNGEPVEFGTQILRVNSA